MKLTTTFVLVLVLTTFISGGSPNDLKKHQIRKNADDKAKNELQEQRKIQDTLIKNPYLVLPRVKDYPSVF